MLLLLLAMLNAHSALRLAILLYALGCSGKEMLVVMVGREGDDLKLRFTPEEVFADVGDWVQFQFYPLNHSAVQADFSKPCIPISNSTGKGFFSGFHPLPLDTEILTTFTINITSTDPIFFYCSQGRHCQQGFVGAINPTPNQTLAQFRQAASQAPESLSPGEASTLRPGPILTAQRGFPNKNFNFTNTDKPVANVRAIVGGVLGGVAFFVGLVAFGLFLVSRRANGGAPPAAAARRIRYRIAWFSAA